MLEDALALVFQAQGRGTGIMIQPFFFLSFVSVVSISTHCTPSHIYIVKGNNPSGAPWFPRDKYKEGYTGGFEELIREGAVEK
jgi:hypothetical protein